MKARLCYGENVEVYEVTGADPLELSKALKNLIKGLEDYSWINVNWICTPHDGEYSATVYIHT